MTIVLQHQYWDLAPGESSFSVTLKFGGQPKRLNVPYAAVTRFYDPSVQFALQFAPPEIVEDDPEPEAEPELDRETEGETDEGGDPPASSTERPRDDREQQCGGEGQPITVTSAMCAITAITIFASVSQSVVAAESMSSPSSCALARPRRTSTRTPSEETMRMPPTRYGNAVGPTAFADSGTRMLEEPTSAKTPSASASPANRRVARIHTSRPASASQTLLQRTCSLS